MQEGEILLYLSFADTVQTDATEHVKTLQSRNILPFTDVASRRVQICNWHIVLVQLSGDTKLYFNTLR